MIRANTIGNMVGELGPPRRSKRRRKRTRPERDAFGPIDLGDKVDRDKRFRLAEQAGWTAAELLELARNGELPTYEEIAARDIGVVIRAYCEGMTK